MTPLQAAKLATKSNVKKLVLTHVTWEQDQEPLNLLKQAHGAFKGRIDLAYDMLQITV